MLPIAGTGHFRSLASNEKLRLSGVSLHNLPTARPVASPRYVVISLTVTFSSESAKVCDLAHSSGFDPAVSSPEYYLTPAPNDDAIRKVLLVGRCLIILNNSSYMQ